MTERRIWALASVVAGVIVALARRRTSWGRDEYAIWPDEPAQLAIARCIGGGTRWNMDDHSVWRPLFGTLLAPVYWFTDDPVTVFHTALVLNALLGGIAAALLVFVARRLTPMSPVVVCGRCGDRLARPGECCSPPTSCSPNRSSGRCTSGHCSTLFRLYDTPTLRDGAAGGGARGAGVRHPQPDAAARVDHARSGGAGLALRRRLSIRDAVVSVAIARAGAVLDVEVHELRGRSAVGRTQYPELHERGAGSTHERRRRARVAVGSDVVPARPRRSGSSPTVVSGARSSRAQPGRPAPASARPHPAHHPGRHASTHGLSWWSSVPVGPCRWSSCRTAGAAISCLRPLQRCDRHPVAGGRVSPPCSQRSRTVDSSPRRSWRRGISRSPSGGLLWALRSESCRRPTGSSR